jgi:hypothetical protein
MVTTVGPAVGSKAQIGFAEESKWGHPVSPPDTFIEFTGESVVSSFTNLVSAALRADRAVHKQRIGTETAGGDINFEVAPEGYGTILKHALGKKRTKRKDVAFVIVYEGADTDRVLTLTASALTSTGTTSGDDLDIAISDGMTLQELITAINAGTNHKCFAPWGDGTDTSSGGYFARSLANKDLAGGITLGSADYSTTVLAKTAASVTNLETFTSMPIAPDTNSEYKVFFPVNMKWGIYEHTIDAHSSLPEGLTLEIGRDIAAFNYYGAKVNSLAITANPGEIVTAVANMMCKGGSTVSDPVAAAANTGWSQPLFSLRYAGTQAAATFGIDTDGTRDMFFFSHGPALGELDTYHFTVRRDYFTHDGYFYKTSTIKGLMEFMEHESSYFSISRKGGYNPAALSSTIADNNNAALAAATSRTVYKAIDTGAVPLFRGNYIGADSGTSKTYYVKVSTGGACDGSHAAFQGSDDNSNWSTATLITSGQWYDILDDDDIDTGFDIMFPENVTLVVSDLWTITTFKDENASVTYQTEDMFTGFQGAVTLNKGDGSGAVSQGVMGINFTINNNLYGDKFELGDRQRAALVPQRRSTEGSMTLEFDNLDIYRMFVNGIAGDLNITLTSDEYINSSSTKHSLAIRLPNIKYSGNTPNAAGEAIITTDFPFNALYDDTGSIPDVRITLINGNAYI